MTDHNVDRRITDALRAYEASIPEEELTMTARPAHRRSRWPIGLAAVAAGTIAGAALAIVLLNRPDTPVGADDPTPTASPTASASAPDVTATPLPTSTASPLPSDPAPPETRDGWSATPIGVTSPANLNAVAPWGDGLMLLGRSESTLAGIWISSDGASWTPADVPDSPEGAAVFMTAAVGTSTGYTAVGTLGHPGGSGPMGSVLWTSPDGQTWSEPASAAAVRDRLIGVLATSGDTVIAAGDAIWRSIDGGATWTEVLAPADDGWTIMDIVLHENRFVATGFVGFPITGPSTAAVWTSEDGLTWSRSELDGESATSLAPLPDGRLVAVGEADNQLLAWISSDGAAWEPVAVTGPCCIIDVAASPTGVVGVGFGPHAGAVSVTTTDGSAWGREVGIPASINDLIHHPRFGLVGAGADSDNVPSLILGPDPHP